MTFKLKYLNIYSQITIAEAQVNVKQITIELYV